MTNATDQETLDLALAAALAASAFKKGDRVLVEHPVYDGPGVITEHGWLENIVSAKPTHYLVWWVDPQTANPRDWPGMLDIVDPQYGLDDRGKTIKKVTT